MYACGGHDGCRSGRTPHTALSLLSDTAGPGFYDSNKPKGKERMCPQASGRTLPRHTEQGRKHAMTGNIVCSAHPLTNDVDARRSSTLEHTARER